MLELNQNNLLPIKAIVYRIVCLIRRMGNTHLHVKVIPLQFKLKVQIAFVRDDSITSYIIIKSIHRHVAIQRIYLTMNCIHQTPLIIRQIHHSPTCHNKIIIMPLITLQILIISFDNRTLLQLLLLLLLRPL